MDHINKFFKKISNLTPPQRYTKRACKSVIKNLLNIDVEEDKINIKRNTIYIQESPSIKSEIFLNKKEILQKLQEELKLYNKTINDIR